MMHASNDVLETGRKLLTDLVEDPDSFSKFNDLLSMFFKGLPIFMLETLLQHEDERVIATALFLAEELHGKATPLLMKIIGHVHDKNPRIRNAAYDALCSCISKDNEQAFVHVVLGIRDSDLSCCKTAMLWMMRACDSWLKAALLALDSAKLDDGIQEGLCMLLGESSHNAARIKAWILDESLLIRKFGTIAAGRVANLQPNLINLASRSEAPELRESAMAQIQFRAIQQRHQKN